MGNNFRAVPVHFCCSKPVVELLTLYIIDHATGDKAVVWFEKHMTCDDILVWT